VIREVELRPGYPIPPVILGGWQLSAGHSEQRRAPSQIHQTWDRALDLGFDVFDCADIYTGVEALIGEYVSRRRAAGTRLPRVHTKLVPDLGRLAGIDRGYVERIIDRSLARLRVERLDLVQFHWWDYRVPGYLEVVGWLGDLVRRGKVRLIGLTNFDAPRTEEILALGIEIASTQVQYSVLDHRPARQLALVAEANRLGILAYGSVAGGFLSDRWLGAPEPATWDNRSLVKYRLIIDEIGGWEPFQAVLRQLSSVARRHDTSIAAVAQRWVLDRPAVASLVVGTRHAAHLDGLVSMANLGLTEEDRASIREVVGEDSGPPGDVYDVERVPGGKHAVIMRYDLNATARD
jgi:aryl-alcohol dehydrogenase-like predicted oxidoreductase